MGDKELDWYHGYDEECNEANRCLSEEVARFRLKKYGGYIHSRPKPEPFTLVEFVPWR